MKETQQRPKRRRESESDTIHNKKHLVWMCTIYVLFFFDEKLTVRSSINYCKKEVAPKKNISTLKIYAQLWHNHLSISRQNIVHYFFLVYVLINIRGHKAPYFFLPTTALFLCVCTSCALKKSKYIYNRIRGSFTHSLARRSLWSMDTLRYSKNC